MLQNAADTYCKSQQNKSAEDAGVCERIAGPDGIPNLQNNKW